MSEHDVRLIVSGKEQRYPAGMRTAELEDERDRLEAHYATRTPSKAQRGTFARRSRG